MWTRRLSELTLLAAVGLTSLDATAAPPAAGTADDPLSDYRERFKQGMDRYKAGAFTEAIGYWEPIYGELGEQRGYRLAYNLGVAYQELGDATRAAEHLQSFLSQVDARRTRNEAQPGLVAKEEADAKDRIAALTAAKGRIRVDPGSPPRAVQVDAMDARLAAFVAWVNPGQHTVTFAPGTPTAEVKTLEMHAGELVDVAPSPAPTAPPVPIAPPVATPVASSSTAPPPLAPAAASSPSASEAPHPPFSPVLLVVTGGLAVAAGVAAIPLDNSAWSARNRALGEATNTPDASSFYTARSWAYGAIGVGVGLGVVTAALATWYFLGSSERGVVVAPGGVAGRF
jgi:hypothetical protein